MSRAYNFCAGPAALPEEVLRRAQEEMLSYQGLGLSVMEMSHRSEQFVKIAEEAESDLRSLLSIPDNYSVLFLQGGASQQFAQIPLNLLMDGKGADYICTGSWSKKAIKEAQKYGDIHIAASSEESNFTYAPAPNEWNVRPDSAYVHYTPNETIHGVEYLQIPELALSDELPLIADMSSTILSRPIDISRFGLVYAGAQKNIGPAGITLVIVRRDLLERSSERVIPTMLSYQTHASNGSMYNTPPTYSWYLAGLVFKWLIKQGGLEGIAAVNQRKAEKLYKFIDDSDFYSNPVAVDSRSWMNIPFILADAALDKPFLAEAEKSSLMNLKGHRSVGGMRASLYNAVPEEAVDALIAFMAQFEKDRA